MADNNRPDEPPRASVGLLLGGVLVVAAVVFMLTGGQLGGVKEVNGDADMPPIASPAGPPSK
jgi:hypothetical protein